VSFGFDFTEFLSQQRMLIISPHADDESAGAGGLMSRIKAAGGETYVMVISVGDLDHFDERDGQLTQKSTRKDELADAMKILDVDDWEIIWEDSDVHMRIDDIPRRDLVNYIEREAKLATEKIRPTMLVLPAPSFNQDHVAVYHAGITATRPHLHTMKAFQPFVLVADAPQLAWQSDIPFRPNFYVDITGEHLERKLSAYAAHKSQQRPAPHQGGVDALRLLAQARGVEISVEAAEAFMTYRFVI
jgi:LmbE family N-acetylglucosaminyl deacetylase